MALAPKKMGTAVPCITNVFYDVLRGASAADNFNENKGVPVERGRHE